MADPVIKKRPVVLRLAELQKYPTLEDRYAATLPFKGGAADCDCLRYSSESNCCDITPHSVREKCIKRTGERWAWFSSARDLDDTYGKRLGTLIYLPWEIRQIIIEMLFDGVLGYLGIIYVDNIIRGISSKANGYFYDHEPFDGLWLASPSTKFEMDHYYFSNAEFEFCYPGVLENFADKLSTYEWSLLRSVTLHLGHNDRLSDWVSACARLPPNLVSIQFILSHWNTMSGTQIHGQWFIIPKGFRRNPDELLDRTVMSVNTLGRLAHRLAAKAKIGLVVDGREVDWDGHKYTNSPHYRVLDDLDPWSKDYLRWWEEETKIDFEGDETFNKTAWNPYVLCAHQDRPWEAES